MILLGVFSGVLLWGDLLNPYNWFLIYITGTFGLLGAYDDYQKNNKNNSIGVSKFKIIIQIFLKKFNRYFNFIFFFKKFSEIENLYASFFKNLVIIFRKVLTCTFYLF